MAPAAERGRVWFRRWPGAVRVVVRQCQCIEVVQIASVMQNNLFLELSKCSLFLQDNGWVGLAQVSNCQARGQGVLCGGACCLNFLSIDFRIGPPGIFAYSPFCAVFNTSGQPAASLPLGWSSSGLPIGVHLAAGSTFNMIKIDRGECF